MKNLATFIFLVLLFSCQSKRYTEYEFNGVKLVRIDFDGATNFYYSRSQDIVDLESKNFVRAEYYGLNNGMDLLVVFKNDSEIEIVNYGVDHLFENGNSYLKIGHYSNEKLGRVVNNYRLLGYEIYRISSVPKLEKNFPENDNSKVKVYRGS
jgi:hypothetical protein